MDRLDRVITVVLNPDAGRWPPTRRTGPAASTSPRESTRPKDCPMTVSRIPGPVPCP